MKERLTAHSATIGKFNFTLVWHDRNDLDLHVICPCGTHISYSNKKCHSCGGFLDVDARYIDNPIEHVYFNNPKQGKYEYYVHFWGRYQTGPSSSQFNLTIHGK